MKFARWFQYVRPNPTKWELTAEERRQISAEYRARLADDPDRNDSTEARA